MTGFSIAINAWGVHTILHKALSAAEADLWIARLREAAGSHGRDPAREWGVIADLRGLDGAAPLPAVMAGLADLAGRSGAHSSDIGRCAVIAADQGQADRLGRLASGADAADRMRILPVAGRDRIQIAAAYGWTLNGREPDCAVRPSRGAVLPFARPSQTRSVPRPPADRAFRKAS